MQEFSVCYLYIVLNSQQNQFKMIKLSDFWRHFPYGNHSKWLLLLSIIAQKILFLVEMEFYSYYVNDLVHKSHGRRVTCLVLWTLFEKRSVKTRCSFHFPSLSSETGICQLGVVDPLWVVAEFPSWEDYNKQTLFSNILKKTKYFYFFQNHKKYKNYVIFPIDCLSKVGKNRTVPYTYKKLYCYRNIILPKMTMTSKVCGTKNS